jgi:hypothetical protein
MYELKIQKWITTSQIVFDFSSYTLSHSWIRGDFKIGTFGAVKIKTNKQTAKMLALCFSNPITHKDCSPIMFGWRYPNAHNRITKKHLSNEYTKLSLGFSI